MRKPSEHVPWQHCTASIVPVCAVCVCVCERERERESERERERQVVCVSERERVCVLCIGAVFAPACFGHCLTENQLFWTREVVSDTSPNMSLADFLFSWVRGHSSPSQASSLFIFIFLFSFLSSSGVFILFLFLFSFLSSWVRGDSFPQVSVREKTCNK